MCGVNGFTFNSLKKLELMNRELSHRGPDYSGVYLDNNLSLGHVLLSIRGSIDISKQPYLKKNLIIYCNISIIFSCDLWPDLIFTLIVDVLKCFAIFFIISLFASPLTGLDLTPILIWFSLTFRNSLENSTVTL